MIDIFNEFIHIFVTYTCLSMVNVLVSETFVFLTEGLRDLLAFWICLMLNKKYIMQMNKNLHSRHSANEIPIKISTFEEVERNIWNSISLDWAWSRLIGLFSQIFVNAIELMNKHDWKFESNLAPTINSLVLMFLFWFFIRCNAR